MLFTCLPPGGRIEGRFPGPPRPRGKHFTVDIHCHVHTPKADEIVKDVFTVERDATMRFANERTREVQRQPSASANSSPASKSSGCCCSCTLRASPTGGVLPITTSAM